MSDSIETCVYFENGGVLIVWDTGHRARARSVRLQGPSEARVGSLGTPYLVTYSPVELVDEIVHQGG